MAKHIDTETTLTDHNKGIREITTILCRMLSGAGATGATLSDRAWITALSQFVGQTITPQLVSDITDEAWAQHGALVGEKDTSLGGVTLTTADLVKQYNVNIIQ